MFLQERIVANLTPRWFITTPQPYSAIALLLSGWDGSCWCGMPVREATYGKWFATRYIMGIRFWLCSRMSLKWVISLCWGWGYPAGVTSQKTSSKCNRVRNLPGCQCLVQDFWFFPVMNPRKLYSYSSPAKFLPRARGYPCCSWIRPNLISIRAESWRNPFFPCVVWHEPEGFFLADLYRLTTQWYHVVCTRLREFLRGARIHATSSPLSRDSKES